MLLNESNKDFICKLAVIAGVVFIVVSISTCTIYDNDNQHNNPCAVYKAAYHNRCGSGDYHLECEAIHTQYIECLELKGQPHGKQAQAQY